MRRKRSPAGRRCSGTHGALRVGRGRNQGLEILEEKSEAGDWKLASSESILGAVLLARGNEQEAETRLRAAYEQQQAARGEDSLETKRTRAWLKELHEARQEPL